MRSTPPTGAAPTATCRASRCARCSRGWATRPSCRSPAATRTASPFRATFWAAPRWACATCCASPATVCRRAIIRRRSPCSISTACRCSTSRAPSRDDHHFQSGRKITFAPRVFFGAAENPVGTAARLAGAAPRQEGRRGRAVHPDPVLLRHAAARRASWTRSRRSASLGKVFILAGVGPLRSAKTAEWMRKNVPGMHVPDALIARLAGAKDQAREGPRDLHRADPGDARDPRRSRRAHHGVPAGRIGRRDRRPVASSRKAARPGIPGATKPLQPLKGPLNDRYRNQFRDQGSRHRLRSPVRHHRRAHQSHGPQDPGRRDGRRRLQPGRGRCARPGRGRRAHAGRERGNSAGRRAGDPRARHPAGAVHHRRAAVHRFLHRRRARGRARRVQGQGAGQFRDRRG